MKSIRRFGEKAFLLPAIIIVAVCTQVPFIMNIGIAFINWNLKRPDLGRTFAEFNNFIYFLKNKDFWIVVWQTTQLVLASIILCTIIGYFMALLLDRKMPGINIARALIITPYFLMTTASGVIWKFTMINTSFGWFGKIMKLFMTNPPNIMVSHPMLTLIMIFTWQWMPFFMLIFLGGLQNVPEDVLESARLDGCNWFETTFRIKLPMMINYLQVAIMLGFIFIVKELGLLVTTTKGGPGTVTYTLTYEIYKQLTSSTQVGRVAAVSIITVIMILLIVNTIFKYVDKKAD